MDRGFCLGKRSGLFLSFVLLLTGCSRPVSSETSGEIVATEYFAAEMAKYYQSIEELREDSIAVVSGECMAWESFVSADDVVWTKETFRIDEVLYGDMASDSEIDIYMMGGVVTVEDYLDSYGGYFKEAVTNNYKKYNDHDLVSFVYGDGQLPEVGRKEVVFLTEDDIHGGYFRTGAYMGIFYQEPTDAITEGNEAIYSGYVGEYPLSEIKEALQEIQG